MAKCITTVLPSKKTFEFASLQTLAQPAIGVTNGVLGRRRAPSVDTTLIFTAQTAILLNTPSLVHTAWLRGAHEPDEVEGLGLGHLGNLGERLALVMECTL